MYITCITLIIIYNICIRETHKTLLKNIMANQFSMECRVTEARARINNIAKTSIDIEYDVMNDKAIKNLIPIRYIKMLINKLKTN